MGKVKGDIRVLLSGERVALNYLQRMSGIATYTHSVAKLLEGSKTKLLDTRKTTPNMRVFDMQCDRQPGYNLNDLSDELFAEEITKVSHQAAGGFGLSCKMKEYAPFVLSVNC